MRRLDEIIAGLLPGLRAMVVEEGKTGGRGYSRPAPPPVSWPRSGEEATPLGWRRLGLIREAPAGGWQSRPPGSTRRSA